MEDQQKNLFIAIALTVLIMIGYQLFVLPLFEKPKPPAPIQTQTQTTPSTAPPPATSPTAAPGSAPGIPGAAPGTPAAAPKSRAEVLAESPRIRIDTPKLHGSINLVGGHLDDLTLATYHETPDPKSPEIVLLSPLSAKDGYSIDFGWFAAGPSVQVPTHDTHWIATSEGALTPSHPVELNWDNGQGLTFTRRIAVDENYLFTVTQSVTNHSANEVALFPYGSIARDWQAPVSSSYLLHEGPIGVLNGKLHDGGTCFLHLVDCDKYNYADVKKEPVTDKTTGGWIGFTDKYWLTALVPDQATEVSTKVRLIGAQESERYQAEYGADSPTEIPAGGTVSSSNRIFAGAKEVKLLDRYEGELGIPNLDRAIDFGWFYWITRPIFLFLDFLYGKIGNFGLAIMVLTLTVKLIFFPLANRSYRAMSKMKLLQPEIQKLRDKYGEDKAKLNQEVMALYKRVGANPMAGCLPIFVQIPVFFSLYKVLYVTIEMRQAPFYGWIHDLSAPDPTTWLNLFGAIPWDPTLFFALPVIGSFLHLVSIGAWPLIMGVTMFLQQKLNPAPADPVQAKMMMALPIVFTFMLGQFAAGLVIYWSWNNLLTIAQQWVIMHRAGAA
jgi:YidC/Oxa1 family membrane protein insertase